ncbi:divalent metal cation transporter [Candidatus Methylomirabilis sp.]|uniref:NRAMP family divalent metal transporter n=1 Tax=Candidatus Methylomirabilis sp. TaxID=2032687 RepID=UPI002A5C373F|nr:divalent metal cation transporter [Candidatus Methylomirabilis sp.]
MRLSRIKKRRILRFLAIMGPGIITASVDQDAGGIATYSLAGARYGFGLLWTIPLIVISLAVIQEMNARMGIFAGKGLADLIRERLGVRVTLVALSVLALANLANTVANFAGVAASTEIYGVSRYFSVPASALLLSWLVVKGTYRFVEKAFLVSSALYLVYAVSAFLARPSWLEVLHETVRPNFHMDSAYLTMLITVVGTTIAPWMLFYLQSSVVDKGISTREFSYARADAYLGSVIAGVMMFFIIVACGATLFRHGIRVETAEQAAMAIEPFAGRFAAFLFGFGLFNSSIAAAAVIPLSTAYAVCEGLGWDTGINRTFREAPGFFSIYLSMVGASALLILWPKAPLITIMYLSQTLNGILLPFVLIFMLLLINDRAIMGIRVNSPTFNLIAWGTAALMVVLTLLLLVTSII